MVSFFVCFLLMNRNPFQNFTLGFYELFIFFPAVLLIFQRDILWCYALYKFPDTFSDKRRNHTISQMRMSILNTTTTEQMGYGMVSFFVCFLLMNRNPFQNFTLGFYELFIFFPAVLLIFQRDILWCYALYKFPDTFSDKRLMQINMTGMVICKAK